MADQLQAERRSLLQTACADDPSRAAEVLALVEEDRRTSLRDEARAIVGGHCS